MGRKRRNATTPTDDNDSVVLPDDVGDGLVALLDHCGFFSSESGGGSSRRQQLVQSLKAMASQLLQVDDRFGTPQDEASSELLLVLEDRAISVRHDTNAYLASIDDERSQVFRCSQEFDSSLPKGGRRSWRLFARSVVADYRIQCQWEEEMVRAWMNRTLDKLYSSSTTDDLDSIQQLIRCLNRDAFTQKLQFREGVALIRLLVLRKSDSAGLAEDGVRTLKNTSPLAKSGSATAVVAELNYALADKEVVRASTAWEACEVFLRTSATKRGNNEQPSVTTILIVGPEGSGKTHLCNEMEELALSSVPSTMIVRPQLPRDILHESIGETEDVLISIGETVRTHQGSGLVIVDDVEYIVGGDRSSSGPISHQMLRSQSTMLAVLDSIRRYASPSPCNNILFVFTASAKEVGSNLVRFDRIFHLTPPDEQERRVLISAIFLLDGKLTHSSPREKLYIEQLVVDLVGSTVGRSYAELTQYCRQSIQSLNASDEIDASTDLFIPALVALKERLQWITPESIREGVTNDYFDMRVLTAQDLLTSTANFSMNAGGYDLQLRGNSAANAWKMLQSSIILPLCRSKELRDLLDESGSGAPKNVVGAILLNGEPGSGKSEIAMHCARYAARLLPAVKLIDVSCTSLIQKEVGRSEFCLRRLFDAARKAAPCILLMDGIETVAATWGNDSTTEGTMDRVLSTLLVELDGVEDGNFGQHGGIAVIGITHDARLIDPALKRPGRLDKAVTLSRDWIEATYS